MRSIKNDKRVFSALIEVVDKIEEGWSHIRTSCDMSDILVRSPVENEEEEVLLHLFMSICAQCNFDPKFTILFGPLGVMRDRLNSLYRTHLEDFCGVFSVNLNCELRSFDSDASSIKTMVSPFTTQLVDQIKMRYVQLPHSCRLTLFAALVASVSDSNGDALLHFELCTSLVSAHAHETLTDALEGHKWRKVGKAPTSRMIGSQRPDNSIPLAVGFTFERLKVIRSLLKCSVARKTFGNYIQTDPQDCILPMKDPIFSERSFIQDLALLIDLKYLEVVKHRMTNLPVAPQSTVSSGDCLNTDYIDGVSCFRTDLQSPPHDQLLRFAGGGLLQPLSQGDTKRALMGMHALEKRHRQNVASGREEINIMKSCDGRTCSERQIAHSIRQNNAPYFKLSIPKQSVVQLMAESGIFSDLVDYRLAGSFDTICGEYLK
eukprot:GHVH01004199.1.p1 GENE.GHVH01004199.1~~GHVH01004199.1.p1  ORF type:complete len:432 (-),score=50.70 GHVH01004199.1:72-1367(-)